MSNLTEFQETLYNKLKEIPEGKVSTYGQMAELVGSSGAARAVGSAMKKDPASDYPCWRVVGSDGSLHESAYGSADDQREILKNEGVTFKNEATVDLKESQYQPD
ncbi:MAG: MGMT family protein [bacterium]